MFAGIVQDIRIVQDPNWPAVIIGAIVTGLVGWGLSRLKRHRKE